MSKQNAIQRIDSHEKLCRIMQKQTHDKINKLERQINRIETVSYTHLTLPTNREV